MNDVGSYMPTNPSLYNFLDDNLPGTFMIFLREWVPFIKAVDPTVKALRKLVNRAGNDNKDNTDKEFKDYYYNNRNHLSSFLPKNTFTEDAFQAEVVVFREPQIHHSVERIIAHFPQNQERNHFAQVIELESQPDREDKFTTFFNSLAYHDQINLIKKLIAKANREASAEYIEYCVMDAIDLLDLDYDTLKIEVFNDLKDESELSLYDHYLQIKGDFQKKRLLHDLDDLGRRSGQNEPSRYDTQRDYHALLHLLGPLRRPERISEQSDSIMNANRSFERWSQQHNPTDTSDSEIIKLIRKIKTCFQCLISLIHLHENTPDLKNHVGKQDKLERDARELNDERIDFQTQILHGKIIKVSEQRLQELFPDEKEFGKILKKCNKLGVSVFDADDPLERKKVLEIHAAERYLGGSDRSGPF